MKRAIFSTVIIFVVWTLIDMVVHGYMLAETYKETAELWRPMEEFKHVIMYSVGLIYTFLFVLIYYLLVSDKSTKTGLMYGALFGLGTGVSMGFGTYSFMPISIFLAVAWSLLVLIEAIIGGVIVGTIIKSK